MESPPNGWSREKWEKIQRLRIHWRRRRARRWILFRMARLGVSVLGSLPLGVASGLVGFLAGWAGRIPNPIRTRALRQLRDALGDRLTESERRAAINRMFTNLGRALGEYAVHTTHGRRSALRSIRAIEGAEHVDRALEEGHGVIVVTPHFGNWELMAAGFFDRFPGCVVGTRPRFGPAARMLIGGRAALGVTTVSHTRAREILRRLRDGQVVGLLPDQDMDRLAGMFLPFFGREAYTVTGPATLAWTAKCPVIPLACIRTGPCEHRIEILPPVTPVPRDRPKERWVREMTDAISRAMQDIIAERPDHWVWFHERWKTTPEDLERRRARRARKEAKRTRKRPWSWKWLAMPHTMARGRPTRLRKS